MRPDDVLVRQLQGRAAVAAGVGTAQWGGVSAKSNLLTVAHGQRVAPRAQAMCQTQTAIGDHWTFIEYVDATNIGIRVQTTGFVPAAGVTAQVAWWAFRA